MLVSAEVPTTFCGALVSVCVWLSTDVSNISSSLTSSSFFSSTGTFSSSTGITSVSSIGIALLIASTSASLDVMELPESISSVVFSVAKATFIVVAIATMPVTAGIPTLKAFWTNLLLAIFLLIFEPNVLSNISPIFCEKSFIFWFTSSSFIFSSAICLDILFARAFKTFLSIDNIILFWSFLALLKLFFLDTETIPTYPINTAAIVNIGFIPCKNANAATATPNTVTLIKPVLKKFAT